MSKKNRERRAANARHKAQERRQRHAARASTGSPGPQFHGAAREALLEEQVWAAVAASGAGGPAWERRLLRLAEHGEAAWCCTQRELRGVAGQLWLHGWTPADVVAVSGRQLSAAHADLLAGVVAAEGAARQARGERLHPRWEAQLALVAARAAAVRRVNAVRRLALGVELLALLAYAGDLPKTMPAPGEAPPRHDLSGLDGKILARVRALLAKAESTEFEPEAEALTAKAQELIARHAIAEALLTAGAPPSRAAARRITVEDPYAEAKAGLVDAVASANRCHAVWSMHEGWTTVFGHEGDLDATEVLVASLRSQATAAMARHGSVRARDGRAVTTSFRRSFLSGFAHRIGQRLRTATQSQVDAASGDERLLPVLARRDDDARVAAAEAFPHIVHRSTAVSNGAGWVAGQAAADQARLHPDLAARAS